MTVADQTATSIALPRISSELGADIPTAQWLYLAYTLCISVLLLPMGRLSDAYSRKKIYCSGLSIFAIGAFLAHLSSELQFLIISKAIQGCGAAMVQANGMALMAEAFPARQRGMAIGLYMTVIGLAAVGGPVIGGFLISGFGWRSIYIGSSIVGTLGLGLALIAVSDLNVRVLSDRKKRDWIELSSFDWIGAVLSASTLSSFLLAITYSSRLGWSSGVALSGFVISGLLLLAFLYRETKCQNPIIDITLFRIPIFSIGMITRYLAFMSGSPAYFLLPFYLVQGSGFPEARAAFLLVPGALMMAITGPLSGRLSDKLGSKWPAFSGLCLWAGGILVFYSLDVGSNPMMVSVGMLLMGAGNGIFGSPNTASVMNVVDANRYGVVSALVNIVRTSGNLTGIALGTTLVTTVMTSMGFEPDLSTLSQSIGDPGSNELLLAFTLGMKRTFMVGMCLIGFAVVLAGLRPVLREN